eukprot:513559_1
MASTCLICAILLLSITTNALMNLSTLFNGTAYITPPGGNMFNVKNIGLTGLTELTIERFCLHVNAGSSDNWDATIYTKSGTFFGSESNSSAWTIIHQESLTGGAERWQATFLSNLQSTVSIAPLDTQAFFIRSIYILQYCLRFINNINKYSVTNVRNYYSYSNAPEPGILLENDSNLAIYEGNARSGFFTGTSPRKWNGVIYYSLSTTMPTTNNPTTNMHTTAIPTTNNPTTHQPTTSMPTTDVPTTTTPTTTIPITVMTDMSTNKPTINDNEVFETSVSGNFTQLDESKSNNLWLLFIVLIGSVIGMIIILSVLHAKRRRNKEKDKNNIEICVNSDSQHGIKSSPQSAICAEKLTNISTTDNTAPHMMKNVQMQTVFYDDDDDELYTTNANVEHETTKGNDIMNTRGEGDIDEDELDDQMYLNSPIQTTANNTTNTGGVNRTKDKYESDSDTTKD